MPINELTPVNEWPTRKLPQDRFDDAVKTAMDQMSVMVDELNSAFIPQTNEVIGTINDISPNLPTIIDAPNQAAAAAASAQEAAQSASQAAQSASAASTSAQNAENSETTAASKAAEAAGSASSASSSAQNASSSAATATSEATKAAQSASTASTYAQNAESSASAASTSAQQAAESASAASTSAQQAAESASAASTSAQNAETSATTATSEANRAKEEADRAASVVAVDIATTDKAGIVKPDGTTTTTTFDGTLTVPTFTGSSAGLVPVATSADAKKMLLGNGTWGKAVEIATTEEAGIVKPQTGASDGFELGGDGTLRVRQATDTQRGSVLVSETSKAGAVPIAGTDGKIGTDWVSSMLFNSRVVITESNAAWTPPVTGWARVIVIGGGGAGGGGSGGGSNYDKGGLGGKQGGTTSFGDLHAIGGSGGGGASYPRCGGGGGGAGSVVHGFVYLSTGSPVSVTIGAGGAEQKRYANNEEGTDGEGPQKGLAGSHCTGGCGAAGASAGAALYRTDGGFNYGGVGGSGGLNGSGYGGGGGGGGGVERLAPGGAAGDGGAYGTVYGGAGGAGAIIVEYYNPEKEMV